MQLSSIHENRSYIATIPDRTTEVLAVVIPLTYLGSDRWRVRRAATGRTLYVSGQNILRPATPDESATGQVSAAEAEPHPARQIA